MNSNKKPGLPGIKLAVPPSELINHLNDNPNDFKVVYNACSGPIIFLVTKLLGQDAAEDIFQEVMIILWKNRHKIKSLTHMQGFLFNTCKNICFDVLRRDKRWEERKIVLLRKINDFELNMDKYIMESNVMTLLSIRGLLNDEEFKVLSYCLEKYRLKEISAMMNISVSIVSEIKASAKQKIQNYYRNNKDA